ncbi:MAG: hypothetical protein GXO86_13575 [Chlorobi bacterium]|nr:hypothetical protein [Chlorobiota bacterium]
MKRLSILFLALAALTATSSAQEKENYMMFENTRLVVKTDKYKEFGDAVSKHNKKYHAEGPFHANVWLVSVGANAGQFVWSMGPATYTDLDSRPNGKDHTEDWTQNVMPNVKHVVETNFWKNDKKLSYNPDPENRVSSKLSIRVFDLNDWQGYRFKELMQKVVKVYNEKKYDWTLNTYWSEFDVNTDEDVAVVWGFEKWAWFDKDPQFKKDFEEVNGEGSWENFMEELRGTIRGTKDEVWELIPEMSGTVE